MCEKSFWFLRLLEELLMDVIIIVTDLDKEAIEMLQELNR